MLTRDLSDGVLTLTLNWPKVVNALNAPLLDAISGAETRAIALTGRLSGQQEASAPRTPRSKGRRPPWKTSRKGRGSHGPPCNPP
jgi:hypothetical protein